MNEQDLAQIQRRQRIAEMLMAQGQEPINANRMAGGYVVPVQPLEAVSKIAQQLTGAYLGKKASDRYAEIAQQDRDALANLDLSSPDAEKTLIGQGRIAEALSLRNTNQKARIDERKANLQELNRGVPTGFTRSETGEIAPMPIQGGKNYMDYQMDLARQKAMIPGYGDQERLALAQQKAALQNQKFMMSLDDQARAQAMFEENMAKMKRENELAQKESQYPKLTEGQSKSTAFASQMASADKEIEAIQAGGFDPTSTSSQAQVSLAGGITNPLASAEAQKYRQAQEQWAEAYLRFKTGAAATQSEVDRNIRTFFPQLGDSPDVIKQKEKARRQAFSDISMTTGRGQELLNNRYGQKDQQTTNVIISPDASPEDRAMLERIAAEKGVTPTQPNDVMTEEQKAELMRLRKKYGR